MTEEEWFAEARKAAKYFWCYEELVDDWTDDFKERFAAGEDPYDAVNAVGRRLDLHEFGPAFGGWG